MMRHKKQSQRNKTTASPPQPLVLRFTVKETCDEDDGFCIRNGRLCMLAAFDGCGGMGGRRYRLLGNHTSAYLGSHLYAHEVREYFKKNLMVLCENGVPEDCGTTLESMLRVSAAAYKRDYLDREPSSVIGSMARALPSTAAIVLLEEEKRLCHIYWAGDSRCYLLSESGLYQLTQDDLVGSPDAFENIRIDAAMTNFLCADRLFRLNEDEFVIPKECVVLTATDGAFGYCPTPMHFEALLLETLAQAKSMADWGRKLEERLRVVTADDVTLLLCPVGFSHFGALKEAHAQRLSKLKQHYIPDSPTDEDTLRTLWEEYKAEMRL